MQEELIANRLMVRHTATPSVTQRGLFATEDFKARLIITEHSGLIGFDRHTVEDPQYYSTYAFADTTPDSNNTVIDTWDPNTQTVISLAAYCNDALDPKQYSAR